MRVCRSRNSDCFVHRIRPIGETRADTALIMLGYSPRMLTPFSCVQRLVPDGILHLCLAQFVVRSARLLPGPNRTRRVRGPPRARHGHGHFTWRSSVRCDRVCVCVAPVAFSECNSYFTVSSIRYNIGTCRSLCKPQGANRNPTESCQWWVVGRTREGAVFFFSAKQDTGSRAKSDGNPDEQPHTSWGGWRGWGRDIYVTLYTTPSRMRE
jgi:hypothetical protein